MHTSVDDRFSPAWFEECFSAATGPMGSLPSDIREAAETLCVNHDIKGICDPLYIANVIGFELGRGDGVSNFWNKSRLSEDEVGPALNRLAPRLAHSYGASKDVTADAIRATLIACLKF